MPGITGFITFAGEDSHLSRVIAMAERLKSGGNTELTEARAAPGAALAHTTFRTCLTRPHIASSSDGRVLVVVDGCFHNGREGRSAADTVLGMYEEQGEQCIETLPGSFALAIGDSRKNRLVLATDGFGLRPLYYRTSPHGIAFASAVRALEPDGTPPGPVDEAGICDYLVVGFPTGPRTFFKGVNLMPSGSILTFRNGKVENRRYWRLAFNSAENRRSRMEEWVSAAEEAFLQALEDCTRGAAVVEVPLSGGLDSRCIVAVLHRLGVPMRTYTIGSADSEDARIAGMIARRLRIPHTSWALEPEDCLHWVREGVRITDGMFPAFDAHILHVASHLPEDSHLVLDGASSLDGYFPRHSLSIHRYLLPRAPRLQLLRKICSRPLFDKTGSLTSGDLFTDRFRQKAENTLTATLAHLDSCFPPDTSDAFDLLDSLDLSQRLRRYNSLGAHLLRTRCETLQPFFHPSVIEFARTLPGRLRGAGKPIIAELLHRLTPELSDIPYERTGLPPRATAPRICLARAIRLARKMAAAAIPGLPSPSGGMAIDYYRWLRTSAPLQTFLRDLLLDPRTLDRGYFSPEAMTRLIEDQLSGRTYNLTLLSRLVSLELWHRYFLEGEQSGDPSENRPMEAATL